MNKSQLNAAGRQNANDNKPITATNATTGGPRIEKPRLAEAIQGKCFDCIPHERDEPGTHREQIACCPVRRCSLWPHRPAPRKTRVNGFVDEAKIQPIIDKIDRIKAKRKASGQ